MTSRVLQLLEEFHRQEIRYCLMRRLTPLGDDPHRGEVDLLVDPRHAARLADVARTHGWVQLSSLGHAPHRFFMAYDAERDGWLKLDVVTALRYGRPIRALDLRMADACLLHRQRRGIVYVLSPEHELLRLLLHCVMHRRAFQPYHRSRLAALLAQLRNSAAEIRLGQEVQALFASALSWELVRGSIEASCWQELLQRRRAIACRMAGGDLPGTAWRFLAGRVARWLRPIFCSLFRRGLAVALLAPDGAGKTTLAAALRRVAPLQARVVYMGMYGHAAARSPAANARKMWKSLAFPMRLFGQWSRYAAAHYHRLRGRVVIFDRFIYDSWLGQPPASAWKHFRRKLLEAGCPKPDLIFYLDAPADLLYRRKGEHSVQWLEAQRDGYLGLQSRLPQMLVMDAAQEADQVRRTATAVIWKHHTARLERASRWMA